MHCPAGHRVDFVMEAQARKDGGIMVRERPRRGRVLGFHDPDAKGPGRIEHQTQRENTGAVFDQALPIRGMPTHHFRFRGRDVLHEGRSRRNQLAKERLHGDSFLWGSGAILLQPDVADAGDGGNAGERTPDAVGGVPGAAVLAAEAGTLVPGEDGAVVAGAAVLVAGAGSGTEATVSIFGLSQLPVTR